MSAYGVATVIAMIIVAGISYYSGWQGGKLRGEIVERRRVRPWTELANPILCELRLNNAEKVVVTIWREKDDPDTWHAVSTSYVGSPFAADDLKEDK